MPQTKAPAKRKKSPSKKRARTRRSTADDNGRQPGLLEQSGIYVARNYMKFIKKYPGEYIVTLGNRVLAHGTDLDDVEERAIQKAGDDAMSAVLDFIPESIEDACLI